MRNAVLVDAGPLIALFDRDDNYHQKIVDFIKDKGYKFVTTTAVITEVSHMLDFDLRVQLHFFEWVMREGVILHPIEQDDMVRIVELTQKYSDRPMDFADATLVIAAEKRGIRQILSIDSDFDIYRLPGKAMIENLFKE
ncbi:MAG: PIN domain-containing protein [Rectinemataceae bacterium]